MTRYIELVALENGAHDNFATIDDLETPEGWAIIPDDIEIPETFPFVDITVEDGIVTSMTAGVMPEPAPAPEPEPDIWDELADAIRNGVNGVD